MEMAPPPPLLAVLLAKVQFVAVTVPPRFSIAPPLSSALLPLKTPFVTVSVACGPT